MGSGADDVSGLDTLAAATGETVKEPVARQSKRMLQAWKRGDAIGRFVVLEPLGAGGMGIVVSAYDPQLDRKVAIKIVRPDFGGDSKRLLREAQAMAKLVHENVITVFDVGALGNDVFIAMEYVDGGTLGAWLKRAPRSWRDALAMLVKAGRGLAAAHAAGLVHRDFKPENVLVGHDGRVRVTDFGLVGTAGAPEPEDKDAPPAAPATALEEQLTRTGAIMGTPAYMAPEQFDGADVDQRADQFAFCVALYEALCGRAPFEGKTFAALMDAVTSGRVIPFPRTIRVPAAIRAAILRGLAIDPADRFPSLDALLAVLERDVGVRRRRVALAVGFAAALVAVGFGVRQLTATAAAPCQDASDRLAGAWDAATRQRTSTAFAAAARDLAQPSFERVAGAIDEYARRWVAGHRDACEATAVRHEQSEQLLDLRMQCLQRRRGELAALTALFATADRELVAKAPQAAYALIAPETCADREALAAAYPPPRPDQSARVGELRAQLADATARQAAGKFSDAMARATPLVAAARTLDYPPLLAEALFLESGLARDLKNAAPAETGMLELTRVGARARDDRLVARAWVDLVYVLGFLAGRPTDALAFEHPARSMLDRAGGGDARVRARLENNLGLAYTKLGKSAEARTHQERALAIQEKELGAEHLDVALTLNNLAIIAHAEGRYEDEIELCDRATTIREKALGPDHPVLVGTLGNKALALAALDRRQEALALNARILALLERVLGPDAPQITINLVNTADLHVGAGDFEAAVKLYMRALAIAERSGPDTPLAAATHSGLGEALVGAERCTDALPHLERAIAILDRTGADKAVIADSLRSISECERRAGKLADARAHIDRAVAVDEALARDSPTLGDELTSRGELALLERRPADARADFERAVAIREKAHGPGAYFVARPLAGLGEALLALRKPREALPHLERALALEEAKGTPRALGRCRALLAQARSAK